MKISVSKIINNPYHTHEELVDVVNFVHSYFRNYVNNIDDFYYFWNNTKGQRLKIIVQIVYTFHNFHKTYPHNHWLNTIFELEGILNIEHNKFSISNRIKKLLLKNLNLTEKCIIINSFMFSKPYNSQLQKTDLYHVYCSYQKICNDQCIINDISKLNHYCGYIIDKIYQMRISAVHLGNVPSLVLRKDKTNNRKLLKIYDKFAIRGTNTFINFSTTLTESYFEYLIKKSLWKHLIKNS